MDERDLSLLESRLEEIKSMGWIKNHRPGNVGGVGNTLEDLLDVSENNLQMPDFGEWELKSQRSNTTSLLTLFHTEPNPRSAGIVPNIFLKKYSWPHPDAGTKYPLNEMSFRQTITTTGYSDRGFKVGIDYNANIIFIDFNYSMIDDEHAEWRSMVKSRAGTGPLKPTPYWNFDEINEKIQTKLHNLMYVKAKTKKELGIEYFRYDHIEAYISPSFESFLNLLESGLIYADFDARTGHNHGSKFRIRPSAKKDLYEFCVTV